mmetsp:Transcript_39507/g.54852  ORF Transcript_39507/g.54852 Transcript_39507/m.54852 type:complete len:701 (+) Transcript_39507:143-2245(+)|eukprot:CAMPEP_0196573080 /NCGR_PEP_ID=MMETSP1081-20130531/3035_1 /TAXON_ID=36882 /ORGANISM="Pyramimonas amylifera, Strain CCMP720" /LENGTH=700 /DNA_ID=CAMNT_0041890655 /DNA_START=133 /DNA_END=2235 /DNA_ORIENTATION=-
MASVKVNRRVTRFVCALSFVSLASIFFHSVHDVVQTNTFLKFASNNFFNQRDIFDLDASHLISPSSETVFDGLPRRHLLSSCKCPPIYEWHRQGGVILYFVGVIYLFLGLAIVCDDFFVPSLEKISLALDLSEDVAGATFMAAGSSAPELFSSLTALMNPDADDSIGIATIVGSAMFNVLIIIGVTGALAGSPLYLDWKPLIRDAAFYAICIVLLIVCIMDGKVYPAEGGVMLGMYVIYVTFMRFNRHIFLVLDQTFPDWAPQKYTPEQDSQLALTSLVEQGIKDASIHSLPPPAPLETAAPALRFQQAVQTNILVHRFIRNTRATYHNKRMEALRLQEPGEKRRPMPSHKSLSNFMEGGSAMDGNSTLRPGTTKLNPMRSLSLKGMQPPPHTSSQIKHSSYANIASMEEGTPYGDLSSGTPAEREQSLDLKAIRIGSCSLENNGTDDSNKAGNGDIASGNISPLIIQAGNVIETQSSHKAADLEEEKSEEEEKEEEIDNPFEFPAGEGWFKVFLWAISIPFYALFTVSIPDCRRQRFESWYWGSFFMSILWIGVISWFMVDWANFIGCVLGIPPVAMGVTVLAAGTSIPDALGSLFVAQLGQGDMAVSNAIGSNVFDILVGLGFPWLITSLSRGGHIEVSTDDLFMNVFFLAAVLVMYFGLILYNKMVLTKTAGFILMSGYFAFVLFTVIRNIIYPSNC